MIEAGRRIVAPCPHQGACPIKPGQDWCHFGARVNRSALHRRIKDADLSYEDEKFSYVVGVPGEGLHDPGGRVLRRPTQRKGLVSLRLCNPDGTCSDRIVTKRHGDDYRRARDVSWGDLF
jgi:ribosomal protein RSM22 (predicted rRNA methylase)